MSLAPNLATVADLYRKLERESRRTYGSTDPVDKADHFFNFCVTASAMRDYALEQLGKIRDEDQRPFFDEWNAIPSLVAAHEIANTSKHFVLRDRRTRLPRPVKTRDVQHHKAKFIEVYEDKDGRYYWNDAELPTISIVLSDDTTMQLHDFTKIIIEYWRAFLMKHAVQV
ncbi:hypothetical protein JAO10_16715 [Burkholderia contaminans]|uniref:hypothetical protein n=1 Tax=Burkholderia contaminans TaxID=488447 RepID=UPI0018DB228B|nr:hypothetical protein [Burkholderia contaminans]MBH9721981.1 hypothetical protein [Burkholderia contaminans]